MLCLLSLMWLIPWPPCVHIPFQSNCCIFLKTLQDKVGGRFGRQTHTSHSHCLVGLMIKGPSFEEQSHHPPSTRTCSISVPLFRNITTLTYAPGSLKSPYRSRDSVG
ncbi:hypothetical protein B0H16DRAFT_316135 [Mycena metata]|uniref:Secreted protein n=1 Tax=Mycena metata TaxID=1033252 RepID=A0AAD7JP93_9AGAR|nr:hypothetical protein B0H16DRAFT_316135 [Mycena metata]